MSVTVGFVSIFAERLWNALPESPYFNSGGAILTTAGLILMGGLLAFLMVWTEFTVIACTSALTFMVAGTFKEIVTGIAIILLSPLLLSISGCWLGALNRPCQFEWTWSAGITKEWCGFCFNWSFCCCG